MSVCVWRVICSIVRWEGVWLTVQCWIIQWRSVPMRGFVTVKIIMCGIQHKESVSLTANRSPTQQVRWSPTKNAYAARASSGAPNSSNAPVPLTPSSRVPPASATKTTLKSTASVSLTARRSKKAQVTHLQVSSANARQVTILQSWGWVRRGASLTVLSSPIPNSLARGLTVVCVLRTWIGSITCVRLIATRLGMQVVPQLRRKMRVTARSTTCGSTKSINVVETAQASPTLTQPKSPRSRHAPASTISTGTTRRSSVKSTAQRSTTQTHTACKTLPNASAETPTTGSRTNSSAESTVQRFGTQLTGSTTTVAAVMARSSSTRKNWRVMRHRLRGFSVAYGRYWGWWRLS